MKKTTNLPVVALAGLAILLALNVGSGTLAEVMQKGAKNQLVSSFKNASAAPCQSYMSLRSGNDLWDSWNHYHNYSEVVSGLLYLNATYPAIVDVFSIGRSWEGREIYCVRLTNESITRPKPKVFFIGYHHAREPISAELPLYFTFMAASSFATNETTTRMLNCSEIYIVPALNVDTLDIIHQNEWQRKNTHPYDEDGDDLADEDPPDDQNSDGRIGNLLRWNGIQWVSERLEGTDDDGDGSLNEDWIGGVDLNRNYGWNGTYAVGSPDPGDETYRGPVAFSEPETQAIRNLASQHNFKYAVSFHSGAEYVGTGWGKTEVHNRTFVNAAENLSLLTGAPWYFTGTGWLPSGTFNDWMYGNRTTFAFTCEIYGNYSEWQYEAGPEPETLWETGVFQVFNPDLDQIETVLKRWLPVFSYFTERAVAEAFDSAATSLNVLRTAVWENSSVGVSLTVANRGDFTEIFEVALYANESRVGEEELILQSNTSTTIAFVWDTEGLAKGRYSIRAEVKPVAGETILADNTITAEQIILSITGDGNGDKVVNVLDLILIANHLGHTDGDGHTPYSADWYKCMNTDIQGDGQHNVLDLILCANHLGENWP